MICVARNMPVVAVYLALQPFSSSRVILVPGKNAGPIIAAGACDFPSGVESFRIPAGVLDMGPKIVYTGIKYFALQSNLFDKV